MSVFIFSQGKGGRENQDFVGHLVENDRVVVAVADGMGGTKGGSSASREVISYVLENIRGNKNCNFPRLFQGARDRLVDVAKSDPSLVEMGTTLTLAEIKDGYCRFFHVGDSRIYHIRGNGLITRTKDQSELQYLLDNNILRKSQAANYSRRNILLSVLSPAHDYEIDKGEFKLESGDRLFLITDGVYKVLKKKTLLDLSLAEQDPHKLSETIALKVKSLEPKDDYSCAIYQHP